MFAFAPGVHQSGLTQNGQMMGHRRLRDAAQQINHIADTQPGAAEVVHNLLSGFVGNRFAKGNWVCHRICHIEDRQYDSIINDGLFLSSGRFCILPIQFAKTCEINLRGLQNKIFWGREKD